MSGIITGKHRNEMLRMLVEKLKRDAHEVRIGHAVPIYHFCYCLSCGSATQPCCGH